jgi:hypothetical protein
MHEDLIARLRETPVTLRRLTRGKSPDALTVASAPADWAPIDVVLHVRAAAAIVAPRVMQALVRESPRFESLDERAWADLLRLPEMPLDAQLTGFQIERAELTGTLMKLRPDQWQRTGLHEERGEQTVIAICEQIVEHEAEHVAQLSAMLDGRTARS